VRSFLGWIVADTGNHPAFVPSCKKTLTPFRSARRCHAVSTAVKRDCRYGYFRLRGQKALCFFGHRISRYKPETMPVGVNHHVDKVGIIERNSGLLERFVRKIPRGRPQSPQEPAEPAAIPGQAFASPLRVKVILIPETIFILRRPGLYRPRDVLNCIASSRDQPAHARARALLQYMRHVLPNRIRQIRRSVFRAHP
jgi:hypothetical protein